MSEHWYFFLIFQIIISQQSISREKSKAPICFSSSSPRRNNTTTRIWVRVKFHINARFTFRSRFCVHYARRPPVINASVSISRYVSSRYSLTYMLCRDIYTAGNESTSRSFRSYANRPILALLPKTSPGYKRGNAFGLDSRAWTYRERGGKRYHCASNGSTIPSDRAKSTRWTSERTNERASASLFHRSNYRGDWSISLALVGRPQRAREPRCNLIMKRETADENPSFDCCTFLHRVTYQGQGPSSDMVDVFQGTPRARIYISRKIIFRYRLRRTFVISAVYFDSYFCVCVASSRVERKYTSDTRKFIRLMNFMYLSPIFKTEAKQNEQPALNFRKA